VSIWPLTVIARAPRAFFLNIVKIPTLYGQWLRETGMVFDKFALTWFCLTKPGYVALLALTIYLALTVCLLLRRSKIAAPRNMALAALLPAAFFVIALIPPTMWRQYFAVPVPFLVIGLALPLSHFRRLPDKAGGSKHFKISAAAVGLCALVAVFSNPFVLSGVPRALVPESWVPLHVHGISHDIGEKTREPKLVLTLAPLFARRPGNDRKAD
jgi:hypothetical protein